MDENRKIDELSTKSGQPTLSEDQRQELADLRRQVVYLQVFARNFCFSFFSLETFPNLIFLSII